MILANDTLDTFLKIISLSVFGESDLAVTDFAPKLLALKI